MERPDDRRIFFAQRFIRRPVEQLIDLAVNAAHLRIDDALPEAERKDRPLLVQFDDGGKREFILPRIERTNAVAQRFRQHGDHAVRKVNRRTALPRL